VPEGVAGRVRVCLGKGRELGLPGAALSCTEDDPLASVCGRRIEILAALGVREDDAVAQERQCPGFGRGVVFGKPCSAFATGRPDQLNGRAGDASASYRRHRGGKCPWDETALSGPPIGLLLGVAPRASVILITEPDANRPKTTEPEAFVTKTSALPRPRCSHR
jgi:hypothetical protein